MVSKQSQQPKSSGGSALKRLKKSLHTAGVVGQTSKASRSKKDRKRGAPTEVGKNDADKKLALIRGEFNPFEQKTQKAKFDILGRKLKGSSGKPTLSKQVGEENRKKTLLVEMQNKNRRGGFIDKRFGENNPSLTPEEKMLERFTREKQKTAKTSMFNLEDDEEDLSLTHYGQSLSTMDDFDDAGLGLSDDEDERKQMDKNIVSKLHFGGFGDEPEEEESDRPKSKNEIMKEIIAKSKMHKAERQLAKQEDDDLRENLDEELADIRGLLDTKPARKPLPSQSAVFKRSEDEQPKSKVEADLDDYADYDKAIFELATDQRAQATDRTKTEEEIALEEKEKLEKAERARKRRMEGLDSESEDEDDKKRNKKRKSNAPQGDDLEDDYLAELEDEVDRLGKGLTLEDIQNGVLDEDSEEDSEEDEEDEEDEETDNEDIEDEDDEPLEFGQDDDEDDMNEFGQSGIVKKKKTKPTTSKGEKREIPFTFECPTTHEAFLEIIEGLEVEDCLVVIKRIRVLYHIKLAPENKQKLSHFFNVLVDHMAYIASTTHPLPKQVLEKISLHVFDLAQQLPEPAAQAFHSKLKKMQAEMAQKMKHNAGSAWPDVEDITLLRLIGQVFSTSDLMHPIATPASLFMCHALSQCHVETEIDMGRGLFLTLLILEYQAVSKRFVPEALNFLNKCLVLLAPKQALPEHIAGYFPLSDRQAHLSIEDISLSAQKLQLDQLVTEETNQSMRLSLFQATLVLFERYLQLYASTAALVEVFESTLEMVTLLDRLTWHSDIKMPLETFKGRLERQIRFCREKRMKTPLRLQAHRPVPIAQHLPKFETAYSMDRHYDPDQERAQQRKLEAQLKKEKKGALRELRKDSQFIARERVKERKQKDADYNKYVKGVMTILEGEQSEKKRLERESD
ncbi:putative nucleolar complex protein 14 [Choanephora cucurbitarum]|uniref:Putative nucleolar complex protein 14 n=1 Tax=Choanephora cucurbitarum TaxID=101091 RepID=A0A1C7N167_9FUNG|nr:putative nucleolar complex protein 14 [Choanephora cucurbitarum]